MTAQIIDGRAVADSILADVKHKVERRVREGGSRPFLAALLVGDDPASEYYVRTKRKAGDQVGIGSEEHRLLATASTDEVLEKVSELNSDENVSGILPQLPMPEQVDSDLVVESIDPLRDVDGLHPYNSGRLLLGDPTVVPCTPAGVLELLERATVPIAGRHAVVIGRSEIVGKPVALLLLAANATVTICHSRTQDLPALTRDADIVVAAVGRPGFVTRDMVKPGAAVVDVGINRVDDKVVGDVDPAVAEIAGWLTPVPKGVGPMTVAMLMHNTLRAEERRRG